MTETDRKLAEEALRTGNKKEARRLLRPLVYESPDDWTLWWKLAQATDEIDQKVACVRQVLKINPGHSDGRKLLAQLERKTATPTPVQGIRRPIHDPLSETNATRSTRDERQLSEGSDSRSPQRRPRWALVRLILVTSIAMVIVLLVAQELLVRSIQRPQVPVKALNLNVDGCIVRQASSAELVFKNQTGSGLTLLRGEVGSEKALFRVESDSQTALVVNSGEQARYIARSDDLSTSEGGAVISVPVGSSCIVAIR